MKLFSLCVILGFMVCFLFLAGMADECLFDFLHMEIVSHMYTEQQSSKGEMDNKVCSVKASNNQLRLNIRDNLSMDMHYFLYKPCYTLSIL